MPSNRKIIVYISTSADGYIARPDGDFSWLNRPRPKHNYGFDDFISSIDTVLWGRKTYELGVKFAGNISDSERR
jgi:dihydrofolate reductase